MSKSKKMMDIGSNMSFKNIPSGKGINSQEKKSTRYSLSEHKSIEEQPDQIVKIEIKDLESAPEDWNFYPILDGEEFANLVKSIYEHGLLHPIVIRKIADKHIVLSGHNRVRAYKQIKKELDEIGQSSSDYDQIMAVIKSDISDDEAREIIIDANYVQRQLNQKLMTKSIIEKYKIIQQRRKLSNDDSYKNIKTREIVASEFKLSGRHIDRYKKLENLYSELVEMFYQGKISLELAAKLSSLKPEVQKYIFQKYPKHIVKYPARTSENLKPSLFKTDIDRIMEEIAEETDMIRLTIKEDGKSRIITVIDPDTIEQIKQLLTGE